MPRICQSQQHRSNPPASSIEDYLKQTIAIPFLDQLVSDISLRFDKHSKQAASLQGLLPRNITQTSSLSDIESAVVFYTEDLPNVNILDEEFHRWKLRWKSLPQKDRPQTLRVIKAMFLRQSSKYFHFVKAVCYNSFKLLFL
ncbi:hypothetical protein SPBRAN_1296 [uncultured Candidatus Thioglobus sp.]|nr:hypothetical protein SPBRAN_1296 [uncultured Candidatus Thioglobus sp.]